MKKHFHMLIICLLFMIWIQPYVSVQAPTLRLRADTRPPDAGRVSGRATRRRRGGDDDRGAHAASCRSADRPADVGERGDRGNRSRGGGDQRRPAVPDR